MNPLGEKAPQIKRPIQVALSNHALLQKVCSLNLAAITLHPTQSAGFRFTPNAY